MPDSVFNQSELSQSELFQPEGSQARMPAPDLSLVLGPDDSAFAVGPCRPPRRGGRCISASVHVVVHRRHGAWTHVYRVLQEGAADRLLVHLDKVFEGDRAEEARRWALDHLLDPRPAKACG